MTSVLFLSELTKLFIKQKAVAVTVWLPPGNSIDKKLNAQRYLAIPETCIEHKVVANVEEMNFDALIERILSQTIAIEQPGDQSASNTRVPVVDRDPPVPFTTQVRAFVCLPLIP